MNKEKLLVIIGPTAVGKTKLSVSLAQRFNGEVISGDSMQIYRGMDIGTAKITPDEMQGVPHHLIDLREPWESFSVNEFQTLATDHITQINQRGRLPLLVGGTGLYVQSVTHQFQFAEDSRDEEVRQKWETYLQKHGREALHQALAQKDPIYAEQLHPNNTRRVIRALEIIETTGQSMAEYQGEWEKSSPYELAMVGLTMERQKLYERINHRVDLMIQDGLIEEVQRLLDEGVPVDCQSFSGIGYKEILGYLTGELEREEAIALLKRNTRRFAKRQHTWFRRMKDIQWFDVTALDRWEEHEQIIAEYVAGKFC
ncbi:tRNA (adenosine(37)-N6)-dimethylallyltransferase MiaA [Caldalkalibacillus salinus]|uniref:tRNA (adenosine(37)-N6)-dimethylallyltransferase MiaA n=1 Tax=Caldalkalibacillus salinus TaxID=2803787 RepID=UPI001923B56E|nr:tRNA (adenosine(37)-N6)-dimethylallyltransferase MiaA [Caldalkalibacillus salinus]